MLISSPLSEKLGLLPRLDLDRQRLNMARRFDWSFPPPEETIGLQDVAQPDWDAYLVKVEEIKAEAVCRIPGAVL